MARKEIQGLRIEEMQFLGMTRPPKTLDDVRNPDNPLRLREKIEKNRTEERKEKEEAYEAAKLTMEEDIEFQEREDIMEEEIRKRQNWVQEYKSMRNGKIPDAIGMKGGYYDRFNVADPAQPPPEEEEKGKKKKKEAKKKEAKGKGKKKGEKDEVKENPLDELKVTEVVKKFEM